MSLPTTVGHAYLALAIRRLNAAFESIKHCVDQLDDVQVWWRPHEAMNSIANLLLHLCGNLTQWIIAGVRHEPDHRHRPQEFAARGGIPKAELLSRLEQVVRTAQNVLKHTTDAQLLEPRRIQGFEGTVLSASFDSLTHLAGHAQEIIYITRLQLGERYRFAWVPATTEEGPPTA
jgi:hypothetical protein